MKILIKIITTFVLIFWILWINQTEAIDFSWKQLININTNSNSSIQNSSNISWSSKINFNTIQWATNIKSHSLLNINKSWNVVDNIESIWFSVLTIIKYIVSWLLVLFLVYAWIQIIISMWTDEEKLSSWKRQLWYTILWLAFINIPGTIYNVFISTKWQIDWKIVWTWSNQVSEQGGNIFMNIFSFNSTLNWWIILFLESVIFSVAIFVIMLAGIKILASRWREEEITEAKNKILWSIIWLIFIWLIESWQKFIYNGVVADWTSLFLTLEKLALFFAWPTAIIFLTLAWWYYITANGDEDKIKKAKSIIINTIIATIILLASHAFLKDLITLTI